MPRRAQLALPSIRWHIIQRRNNRAVCFHAEEDYQLYLHYLNEFSDKFGGAIHAYVLMTDQVHLLLIPARAYLAGLMMDQKWLRSSAPQTPIVSVEQTVARKLAPSTRIERATYPLGGGSSIH